MSNSWRYHGLQHARLPCPSLFPEVCSNSCPLSQWCYLTISSSAAPFSSCPQSLQFKNCLRTSILSLLICVITLARGNVKWSHRKQTNKKKAKPDRSFSKFVSKILKIYVELQIKICKDETLLKNKKKRLNYPFYFDTYKVCHYMNAIYLTYPPL